MLEPRDLHFTMRAVRFYGRGDIRVDEIDKPVCGEGQVKVTGIWYPTFLSK